MRRSALCLFLVAAVVATGAAAAPPRSLEGTWAGLVRQNAGVAPFRLELTLTRPVRTAVGKVELGRGRCLGTVRYLRESGAASVFAMRWSRGNCLAGTMWLRTSDGNLLAYRWEGRYRDGRRARSTALLVRRSNG